MTNALLGIPDFNRHGRLRAHGSADLVVDLPGGGCARRTASDGHRLDLALVGELDVFDRYALVDLLTAATLDGARHLHIDAHDLQFVDTACLRAIERVGRFVEASSGSITVVGLSQPFLRVWELLRSLPRAPGRRAAALI